jgi:hypothetical protein
MPHPVPHRTQPLVIVVHLLDNISSVVDFSVGGGNIYPSSHGHSVRRQYNWRAAQLVYTRKQSKTLYRLASSNHHGPYPIIQLVHFNPQIPLLSSDIFSQMNPSPNIDIVFIYTRMYAPITSKTFYSLFLLDRVSAFTSDITFVVHIHFRHKHLPSSHCIVLYYLFTMDLVSLVQ